MEGVGFIAAFSAGILSFFSPCVLPLIPAYICFITGSTIDELVESNKGVGSILPNTILFILGFSVVFVILGASATFLGSFLFTEKSLLKIIGGIIVILFGLHISGLFNIRFLQVEKKIHVKDKPINLFGSFLVGIAFGFGWTPCVGPILGSILLVAATKDSVNHGIILLSLYSLGLALPFIIVAFCIGGILKTFSKIKRYFRIISVLSGVLLVVVGIWIIFGPRSF